MTFHGNRGDPGECNECCDICEIGSDSGQGADSSDITPPWDEIEGDSERINDTLRLPGPARIIFQAAHPLGDTGNQYVGVKFEIESLDSGTARPRVILSWADDDNYLAVEVEYIDASCSHLRLFQVSGGTETEIQDQQFLPGAALAGTYFIQACWEPHDMSSSGSGSGSGTTPGRLRARVRLPNGDVFGTVGYAYARGAYVGLDVREGVVTFHDHKFDHETLDEGYEDCPNCRTDCLIYEGVVDCAFDSGSVTTGVLTASGYTLHTVFHPGLGTRMKVSVQCEDWAASISRSVYINTYDSTHGLQAIFSSTGSAQTLTLKRNGITVGSPKTINTAPPVGTSVLTIELCYDGFIFSVSGTSNVSLCVSAAASEVVDGKWAAVGAGVWSGWSFSKTHSDEDPECADCVACPVVCNHCLDDIQPSAIKAVASGFITGSPCSGCANINGANILTGDGCFWAKELLSTLCDVSGSGNFVHRTLQVYLVGPGEIDILGNTTSTYRLNAFINCTGAQDSIYWMVDLGVDKPDCTAWVDLELPVVWSNPPNCCYTADPLFVTSL